MEFGSEFITLFDRVQIRYYGIIIVVAMLIAATIAARLAQRDKRDPDHIWGALTWAIIPAILGARLWFILFPPASLVAQGQDTAWFFQNFFNPENGAIAIWSGGLHIFGAMLGGLLGAYIYMRRNNLEIPVWMDYAGIAMPLGQAIGRWANYVNQELYGFPTTLPWGIAIDSAKRVGEYRSLVDFPATTTFFHPLFLYESLWSLAAFIVLLFLFLRKRKSFSPGDFFLIYIMQYTFIRFLLEFIRVEQSFVLGLPFTQAVCLLAFAGALLAYIMRHRQQTPVQTKATA
jgi:phosphatidylglycerol:prolipoprotein diacylglycerol transferase